MTCPWRGRRWDPRMISCPSGPDCLYPLQLLSVQKNSKLCILAYEVAAEIEPRMRDEFNHPCDTPPPS